MSRLKQLVRAFQPSAIERDMVTLEHVAESTAALQDELSALREDVRTLEAQVAESRRQADALVDVYCSEVNDRARIAGLPAARLQSDFIDLDGCPSARLRVKRLVVGEPFEGPFSRWMGVTVCATVASDVRALWEHLLAREAGCAGDVLCGPPNTVLDVPGAVVSRSDTQALHLSLRGLPAPTPADECVPDVSPTTDHSVVAVPRFMYAFPQRKLRNFGHWLLDCVPQIVALSMVAPDAAFLVPNPLRGFQRSTLSLVGFMDRQTIPWDGEPVKCSRLLILEGDGRAGGGRPLASLLEMRRRIAAPTPAARPTRRVYVSRRDARATRRWVSNESDVEMLFQSRGFEIIRMDDCPLQEQVRIFREAGVVAGVSGAGLTDLIFSLPEIHVIVLLSDSLIRWYAEEQGARSLWASVARTHGAQLSTLSDSPRFYAHLAAALGQHCHSFLGADDLPIDRLSGFLDDVLGQATAS